MCGLNPASLIKNKLSRCLVVRLRELDMIQSSSLVAMDAERNPNRCLRCTQTTLKSHLFYINNTQLVHFAQHNEFGTLACTAS